MMKATILSHEAAPENSPTEIHRFKFMLEDGHTVPCVEAISLRTARVIVDNLADGNAFIKMLRAIVTANPDYYDELVGNVYPDHFVDCESKPVPLSAGSSSKGPSTCKKRRDCD